MDKQLSQCLSELHKVFLKPSGFKKTGAVFIRQKSGHFERFSVQLSSWNNPTERVFYINCELQFADALDSKGQGGKLPLVWKGRVRDVIQDARDEWSYTPPPSKWSSAPATEMAGFVTELGGLLIRASEVLSTDTKKFRDIAEKRLERIQRLKAERL